MSLTHSARYRLSWFLKKHSTCCKNLQSYLREGRYWFDQAL